ncbi:hypothetical protein OG21DRAFT_636265 [Imleria badia]|nr:hypothetical protein OG21DRAFT_636265 [Imleria badia]
MLRLAELAFSHYYCQWSLRVVCSKYRLNVSIHARGFGSTDPAWIRVGSPYNPLELNQVLTKSLTSFWISARVIQSLHSHNSWWVVELTVRTRVNDPGWPMVESSRGVVEIWVAPDKWRSNHPRVPRRSCDSEVSWSAKKS